MEATTIRIIAVIAAVIVLLIIIWRARKESKESWKDSKAFLRVLSVRWPYALLVTGILCSGVFMQDYPFGWERIYKPAVLVCLAVAAVGLADKDKKLRDCIQELDSRMQAVEARTKRFASTSPTSAEPSNLFPKGI